MKLIGEITRNEKLILEDNIRILLLNLLIEKDIRKATIAYERILKEKLFKPLTVEQMLVNIINFININNLEVYINGVKITKTK